MSVLPTLHRLRHPLADGAAQRALLAGAARHRFEDRLAEAGLAPLHPLGLEVLQVNLGKRCNQTCRHCHVDAGPDRTEVMSGAVIESCLRVLERHEVPCVDLTGGAPELHPDFRRFVSAAAALGCHVIDRCNLTVTRLPNYRDLPAFLAEHRVEVIASLPYHQPRQTDAQRGEGVFEASIAALREFNRLGYGDPASGLVLNLVTNPVGAFLPPPQAEAEREWRDRLASTHGIRFNRLYTITNMPVSRFLQHLEEKGTTAAYLERLARAYNPAAAAQVMCRTTLSVGWDGRLYDCDFNQQLDLGLAHGAPATIADFERPSILERRIATGPHCFGCTAGAGSSCGGATT